MSDREYFTLVFEGDISKFKGNPLKTETPFGVPFAAGMGNAFDKIENIEEIAELSAGATADKPALGVLGSLPSGESDPLVTTDSTGAGSVAQKVPDPRVSKLAAFRQYSLEARLSDVVLMLDAPDVYQRGYIADVCRLILSEVPPTTLATLPGHDETMANLDALTILSTEGK
jgi:hypothetical protein